jgi:Ca2+-transporting ATPase
MTIKKTENGDSRVSPIGLGNAEARALLKVYGENILPSARPKSAFAIAVQTMREPMFSLLLVCAVIYWWLGDHGEAAMLTVGVLGVIVLTFIQERRAEKTLEALRDLSSPRALVIRDGVRQRIAGREVVPGDIVVLAEGDRVPADGDVLSSSSLRVDESLLTGEALPVSKVSKTSQISDPSAAQVFSGSMVVQGEGCAVITATGVRTRIGQIGTAIKNLVPPPSRLMVEVRSVVRWVAIISVMTSLLIMGVAVAGGKPLVDGILMGLTFALGTVPEEFPVVLTIFVAIGAWRISQKRVLTRQMSAMESLGSATFLCVDKTGTLTENRMQVASVWTALGGWEKVCDAVALTTHAAELGGLAAMACAPGSMDPVDVATRRLGESLVVGADKPAILIKAFPMVRPLLAVGCLWQKSPDRMILAVKGAPESVLELCRADRGFSDQVMAAVKEMAARGQRVLGVCHAIADRVVDRLDQSQPMFLGLITYEDPLRDNVCQSVADCHTAGIKVMMMTGDYPLTALAVAREAGILTTEGVLTGAEMDILSDADLAARIETVRVMARMIPEHKLRVVKALQSRGEVVAMTGDGVNDAPALRAAHIGIAMGGRGTDVAREASSLVLLDDQFGSIVDAIRLGRRVFDNLQTAMSYIIAIHIPVAGLALLPVFSGTPAILLPAHMALLELMIDPICSIVFEAEPELRDVMAKPPRPPGAKVFSRSVVMQGLMAGTAALIVVVLANRLSLRHLDHEDHARAVAFALLMMVNIALMTCLRPGQMEFSLRERLHNRTLKWATMALLTLMMLIFYWSPLAKALHFRPPHWSDMVSAVSIGIVCGILFVLSSRQGFVGGHKIAGSVQRRSPW